MDRNLSDLAEWLADDFAFLRWYAEDGRPIPLADGIFAAYPHDVPADRLPHAVGMLASTVFDPYRRDPSLLAAADYEKVNRFRAFAVVTEALRDRLRRRCPNVWHLSNPVNLRRFSEPTLVQNRIIACWAGDARHGHPGGVDLKGFESLIVPACREAGVPLEFAERTVRPVRIDEMPAFYRRANVVLCASLYEGAPNFVMEAMACGHAVIATDVGNLRELQASQRKYLGETGILLVERSREAFARALGDLTPERVAGMGALNRREVELRWSWEAWTPAYRECLSLALPDASEDRAARDAIAPAPTRKRPRVCIVIDVWHWAWAKKAHAVAAELGGEFDIQIHALSDGLPLPEGFDLYHTFDFPLVSLPPPGSRCVTGATAHVLGTWGDARVQAWADRAVALHVNSLLLLEEVRRFHQRIYYLPNGVDPTFWRRTRQRRINDRLVVGHVGKPNPRKGAALIREACDQVGVEFRSIDRRAQDALTAEDVREFYQDLDVIAFASDFDGTPNPALEAAACEVAVVGNRIGNLPEFIEDGRNGFLVERAVESLAEAFRRLAADRRCTVEMGREARETVLCNWTWARQARRYAEMWREALG